MWRYHILRNILSLTVSKTAPTTPPQNWPIKGGYRFPIPINGLKSRFTLLLGDWVLSFPMRNDASSSTTIKDQILEGIAVPPETIMPDNLNDFLLKEQGSWLLRPSLNSDYQWQIDLTKYRKLDVLPGYDHYGCMVYLSETEIKRIDLDDQVILLGDQRFSYGLRVLGATLFLEVIHLHAGIVHLQHGIGLWAEINQEGNFDHLDSILKLTLQGIPDLTSGLPMLIEPRGIFHRYTALTDLGYDNYYSMLFEPTVTNLDHLRGSKGTEWYRMISQYIELVSDLLSELLTGRSSCLPQGWDLDKFVLHFVITTAVHNTFGDELNMVIYLRDLFQGAKIGPRMETDEYLSEILQILVRPRAPTLGEIPELAGWFEKVKECRADWFRPEWFEIAPNY